MTRPDDQESLVGAMIAVVCMFWVAAILMVAMAVLVGCSSPSTGYEQARPTVAAGKPCPEGTP